MVIVPEPGISLLNMILQACSNLNVGLSFHPEQVDMQLVVVIHFVQEVVVPHNCFLKL